MREAQATPARNGDSYGWNAFVHARLQPIGRPAQRRYGYNRIAAYPVPPVSWSLLTIELEDIRAQVGKKEARSGPRFPVLNSIVRTNLKEA